jgi:hypothetical protein
MAINEQIVLSARNQARAAFREVESDARKAAGSLSQGFGQAGAGVKKFSTEFNGPFMQGLQRGKVGLGDFNQLMEKAAGQAGLGTGQFARLAGATGLYKDQQLLAARAQAEAAAKAQQLTQAVASGEMTARQAGKAWGEYARANEVAAAKSGGLIQQVMGIAGKLAVVTGAAIAAGAAINKGLEFGEAGAGLERLNTAGQQLAQGLGGSYDELMEKLRRASMQTVSNSALMLSANRAMMLGLGGDAEQLGQLMEVAAFRGRAMGMSTNQAFSDIVTGIGRASPQILDNLGIVLDSEAAYRAYADQLGKSAEALTKAEKTQALMNATLADGQRQIAAAGGLAADSATSYERWKTASANLADAWKMRLAPAGAFLANKLTAAITTQRVLVDGQEFMINQVDGETKAWQRHGNVLVDATDQYLIMTHQMRATTQAQEGLNTEISKTGRLLPSIGREGGLSELRMEPGQAEALQKFNAELYTTGRRAAEAKEKTANFLGLMGGEMSSPIASFIEDLKWFQAGGWRIEAAFEALKQGLASGAITPTDADVWAGQLFMATEDLQVELGKLNVDDAATNIATTLGITAEQAKQYITGTEGIQGALDRITGTEWNINVRVNYYGDLPAGIPAPTDPNRRVAVRGPKPKMEAVGGPVRAGMPYIVGEQGPELFRPWTSGMILTNQQARAAGSPAGGGGGNVYVGEVNVITSGDPGETYAEVSQALADQLWRAARAGAGYSGA